MMQHIERSSASTGRPLRRLLACVATVLLAGCYVYVPTSRAPEPGARFAFELNDRGRVAMADSVGPGTAVIEGRLLRATDSLYLVEVHAVEAVRGRRSRWSGETVGIRAEHVRDVSERRLSKQRSALLAGGIATGVVAFVVTRELVGSGNAGAGENPGNGNEALKSRRRP